MGRGRRDGIRIDELYITIGNEVAVFALGEDEMLSNRKEARLKVMSLKSKADEIIAQSRTTYSLLDNQMCRVDHLVLTSMESMDSHPESIPSSTCVSFIDGVYCEKK